MAKKQVCPEFENHERWLVAFADMMTLLFALFVVLYSIASVEQSKLDKVAISVQKAFGIPSETETQEGGIPKGNSREEGLFNKMKGDTRRDLLTSRQRREMITIINADANKIERQLQDRLYGPKDFPDGKTGKPDRVVYVNRDPDGIRITLLSRGFFKINQNDLDESALKVLDSVATSVKEMGRVVRIEGHTDNLPFRKDGKTNWELSSLRAAAVARYFTEKHKFPSGMVYSAGFADTMPVAPNDTPENRALNRRVDIKVLYDIPSEIFPQQPGAATPLPAPADPEAPPEKDATEEPANSGAAKDEAPAKEAPADPQPAKH